jgi:hypothetical protein
MGCALAAAESVCCRCRCSRAACGASFKSTAAGDGAYPCRSAGAHYSRDALQCGADARAARVALRCIAPRGRSSPRMRGRRDAGKSVCRMDREHPYLVGVRPHANANRRRFDSIEEGEYREVGRQKSQPEYYRHMIISIN